MLRGPYARKFAIGLTAMLVVASPALALASRCCDGIATEDRLGHACPTCAERSGVTQRSPNAEKRSCCSESGPAGRPAEVPTSAAGYSQCECCTEGTLPPAAANASAVESLNVSAGHFENGLPLADLAASTAGSESVQLFCSALLLEHSRQALFCIWRP